VGGAVVGVVVKGDQPGARALSLDRFFNVIGMPLWPQYRL
jgi:hypothetical protein